MLIVDTTGLFIEKTKVQDPIARILRIFLSVKNWYFELF